MKSKLFSYLATGHRAIYIPSKIKTGLIFSNFYFFLKCRVSWPAFEYQTVPRPETSFYTALTLVARGPKRFVGTGIRTWNLEGADPQAPSYMPLEQPFGFQILYLFGRCLAVSATYIFSATTLPYKTPSRVLNSTSPYFPCSARITWQAQLTKMSNIWMKE
jgi:hypothetical protein